MSQSKSAARGAASHFWKPCALMIGDEFFGGSGLGLETPINTTLHVHVFRETGHTSWIGFCIEIPYGMNNEEEGFGVCHTVNGLTQRITPKDSYKVEIRFSFDPSDAVEKLSADILKKLPATTKHMSLLKVNRTDGRTVNGFGMPFAHSGHPSQGFVMGNVKVCGNTLLDILQQQTFHFVVASPSGVLEKHWTQDMPGPFRYPYGEQHFWDEGRYEEMLLKAKGPQFNRAWSFDNDNEHLAALTQSQVQDVMWIHKASREIGEIRFKAYFINTQNCFPQQSNLFYAIVPLYKLFLTKYKDIWRRIIEPGFLTLKLLHNEEGEDPASWDARIQEFSRSIVILNNHPTNSSDLVLQVRRPCQTEAAKQPEFEVKVFSDRRAATIAFWEDKAQ